jgi:hypothetical protein
VRRGHALERVQGVRVEEQALGRRLAPALARGLVLVRLQYRLKYKRCNSNWRLHKCRKLQSLAKWQRIM